jgi:hypothetical protein
VCETTVTHKPLSTTIHDTVPAAVTPVLRRPLSPLRSWDGDSLPCLASFTTPAPTPCPSPPPPLCLQVSKRLCRQLALGNLEGVTTLALSGCDTSAPGASLGKETILEAVESIGGGGAAVSNVKEAGVLLPASSIVS